MKFGKNVKGKPTIHGSFLAQPIAELQPLYNESNQHLYEKDDSHGIKRINRRNVLGNKEGTAIINFLTEPSSQESKIKKEFNSNKANPVSLLFKEFQGTSPRNKMRHETHSAGLDSQADASDEFDTYRHQSFPKKVKPKPYIENQSKDAKLSEESLEITKDFASAEDQERRRKQFVDKNDKQSKGISGEEYIWDENDSRNRNMTRQLSAEEFADRPGSRESTKQNLYSKEKKNKTPNRSSYPHSTERNLYHKGNEKKTLNGGFYSRAIEDEEDRLRNSKEKKPMHSEEFSKEDVRGNNDSFERRRPDKISNIEKDAILGLVFGSKRHKELATGLNRSRNRYNNPKNTVPSGAKNENIESAKISAGENRRNGSRIGYKIRLTVSGLRPYFSNKQDSGRLSSRLSISNNHQKNFEKVSKRQHVDKNFRHSGREGQLEMRNCDGNSQAPMEQTSYRQKGNSSERNTLSLQEWIASVPGFGQQTTKLKEDPNVYSEYTTIRKRSNGESTKFSDFSEATLTKIYKIRDFNVSVQLKNSSHAFSLAMNNLDESY